VAAEQRTDARAVLLEKRPSALKRTRYDLMAYNVNDIFIGRRSTPTANMCRAGNGYFSTVAFMH
jgi:hypothetical protein